MRIGYNSLNLGPGGFSGPVSHCTINGSQVNQRLDLARAAVAGWIARGNRSNKIRFSVTRIFSGVGACELFAIGHLNTLATSGPLVFTCGGEDGGPVFVLTLPGAVLDGVSFGEPSGVSLVVTYEFSGGIFVPNPCYPLYELLNPSVTDALASVRIATDGASQWLQLKDSADNSWHTVTLSHGTIAISAATPPGTITCREQSGFLQILDTVDACWRDVWCNGPTLDYGPSDTTYGTCEPFTPATAWRLDHPVNGLVLALLDQAGAGQFRQISLTAGAIVYGALEA